MKFCFRLEYLTFKVTPHCASEKKETIKETIMEIATAIVQFYILVFVMVFAMRLIALKYSIYSQFHALLV